MLRIGRYGIAFGGTGVFQTQGAATLRRFLFIWILEEARPDDVDKEKRLPISTETEPEDGRLFRYYKAGKNLPNKQSNELKETD